MLGAKRHDQLLIRLLLARLVEDTHVGLASIEGLAGLAQAAREPVVDESEFEDAFEGFEDGHLALGRCGVGADFDFFGGGDDGGGGLFSVRLVEEGGVVSWGG